MTTKPATCPSRKMMKSSRAPRSPLFPSRPRVPSRMVRCIPACILALALFACACLVSAPVRIVRAEDQHGPTQRIVTGRVLSAADAPVPDAIVYLKDTRSLTVKSFITGPDGAYRFVQLSANTDYQLWAESGGKKSKVKAISSFDTKTQFIIDLKF